MTFNFSSIGVFIASLLLVTQSWAGALKCEDTFLSGPRFEKPRIGLVFERVRFALSRKRDLRNFNEARYEQALKQISEAHDTSDLKPSTLEEYVALLDAHTDSLKISITNMHPILRRKIYRTITKTLLPAIKHSSAISHSQIDHFTQLMWRGDGVSPLKLYDQILASRAKGEPLRFVVFHSYIHFLELHDLVLETFKVPVKSGLFTSTLTKSFNLSHEGAGATFASGLTGLLVYKFGLAALLLPEVRILLLAKPRGILASASSNQNVDEEQVNPELNHWITADITYRAIRHSIHTGWWLMIGYDLFK